MAKVYLNIGSNIQREHHITSCMQTLRSDYPEVIFSRIYETEAFGFEGNAFYNLAAMLETSLSYTEFSAYLKHLEDCHARQRDGVKFSSRTLDIDILLYDELILQPEYDIPRKEIVLYPFVLFPLEEIAPMVLHPELGISIAAIAAQSELDRNVLRLIEW
jgi:2-amino-4-hydroxy-6-hydroxymethyldihydropteridine diphosphokinase